MVAQFFADYGMALIGLMKHQGFRNTDSIPYQAYHDFLIKNEELGV